MRDVQGKVAAITGAASGIGRAVAVLLARRGCHVALSDVDEAGLAQTAQLCGGLDVKVHTAKVDVASREQVHQWAAQVADELGGAHIIINNAGVALGATVEDTDYEDFHWMMDINFWGVVHGTRAFLPQLRARGEGHVVNVSSVFGLIGVPTQAAYVAAKFAVKGFTESLRQELEVEDANIGVTVVHPGGIKTNIARRARLRHRDGWVNEQSGTDFEKVFSTSPESAAEDILEAILRNRRRQLVGTDAVLIDLLQRLLPTLYQSLVVVGMRKRRQAMLGKRG